MKKLIYTVSLISFALLGFSQDTEISGRISSANEPLPAVSVLVESIDAGTTSDSSGFYQLTEIPAGDYVVTASCIGYETSQRKIRIEKGEKLVLNFKLTPKDGSLDEVVVTGTMKEVSRLESPVPVEVYTPSFFRKNPTPSIFDALQNVNGVRPQVNCNICNTGDIHINGLEGPYTMVMIDGMPIVSALSTVYGLSGIPNSLVERVEIVKGPASSLYGSEAVAGLINIITKKTENAPLFTGDFFATSWGEYNTDLGLKLQAGKKASVLTGLNYFKYGNQMDQDGDNFTDVTLQDRISVFQKWNFHRKSGKPLSIAGRYYYEERWGGDMNWNKGHRGGDDIYGESIFTRRWELLGSYQLPLKERLLLSFSYNKHDQNSVYGTTRYLADQDIAFGQLSWDKKIHNHDLLAGLTLRYTFFDDNTTATRTPVGVNKPDNIWLPGLFLQDEISLHDKHKLLLGLRYDRNSVHGNILTPRMAYKWQLNENNILRLNAGTGYRVVNLFTEDHAALTGARDVVIQQDLRPEKSVNVNLNYIRKIYRSNSSSIHLDFSSWYTHFQNRIVADYDTDPDKIIYNNLEGYAVSRGLSANVDGNFSEVFKVIAGVSLMDVFLMNKGGGQKIKEIPMLTEKWTGTWAVSYKVKPLNLTVDYTGNIYGPMRLPLLGELDPRRPNSRIWSLQNIQLTWSGARGYDIYGGVKNILNWTPAKNTAFLIARTNDPFDKDVVYNPDGQVVPTPNNPHALTFDPSYVYAPNQGIRGFLGVRVNIRQ